METKIYKVDEKNIDYNIINKAGKELRDGSLVSFPTETVYGLGANGLDEEAVKKIYKAKGRPSDNPLILHISELEELYPLVENISEDAKKCIKEFWPGPLTMVFEKSDIIPDVITGGLNTVAIRMPSNLIAKEIIKAAQRPIAAPSANLSGRPSPTSAEHVIEDLSGKIEMIIDGGRCEVGLESTVLDLSEDTPTILRPGKVSLEDIRRILPNVEIDKGILKEGQTPKSPGQKYKHYAPKGEMIVYIGESDKIIENIESKANFYLENGSKVGVLLIEENIKKYNLSNEVRIFSLGNDKEGIAKNLFDALRKFDEEGIDVILSEGVNNDDLGLAIMNRMLKASGGNVVKV